jgi:hypothetical protein
MGVATLAPCPCRYYVQAEEIIWDYANLGKNRCNCKYEDNVDECVGDDFGDDENVFLGSYDFEGDNSTYRIGAKYKKTVFREYTDATFTTQINRTERGKLGPQLGFLLLWLLQPLPRGLTWAGISCYACTVAARRTLSLLTAPAVAHARTAELPVNQAVAPHQQAPPYPPQPTQRQ